MSQSSTIATIPWDTPISYVTNGWQNRVSRKEIEYKKVIFALMAFYQIITEKNQYVPIFNFRRVLQKINIKASYSMNKLLS